MTRPVHASDIRNHQRCPRRAALARTHDRGGPSSPAAALGTATHAAVEAHVLTGALPDETSTAGRLAIELLPHVPAVVLGVEVPFSFSWEGIAFAGHIDLVSPGVVVDWKTTGRAPIATLAGEPQPAVYSAAYEAATGRIPECRWIYVHTRTYRVTPVVGVADSLASYAREVDELLENDADPMAAPAVLAACGDYGGCPYVARCGTGGALLEARDRGRR